jgi:hypothetical protein
VGDRGRRRPRVRDPGGRSGAGLQRRGRRLAGDGGRLGVAVRVRIARRTNGDRDTHSHDDRGATGVADRDLDGDAVRDGHAGRGADPGRDGRHRGARRLIDGRRRLERRGRVVHRRWRRILHRRRRIFQRWWRDNAEPDERAHDEPDAGADHDDESDEHTSADEHHGATAHFDGRADAHADTGADADSDPHSDGHAGPDGAYCLGYSFDGEARWEHRDLRFGAHSGCAGQHQVLVYTPGWRAVSL